MNCLQCNKSATETETYNDCKIRECSDGHRTALLTKTETKALDKEIRTAPDLTFTPVTKRSKAIPAVVGKVIDRDVIDWRRGYHDYAEGQ